MSDHDCPMIEFDIRPTPPESTKNTTIKKAIWERFEADLLATDDNISINKDILSISELWQMFSKACHDGTKTYIPHKTCRRKDSLPWITPSIKSLIKPILFVFIAGI